MNTEMEIKDSDKTPSSVIDETEKINEIKWAVAYNLLFNQGVMPFSATLNDYYTANGHNLQFPYAPSLSGGGLGWGLKSQD